MPKKRAVKSKAVKSVLVSPTLAVALAIFSMAFSLMVVMAVGQSAKTGKIKSGQIKMAAAMVYYVDVVSGSDSNPGTQAAPFKTLQKAVGTDWYTINGSSVHYFNGVANCGDTVYVLPGDYTTTYTNYAYKPAIVGRACTANNPLIIRAVNSAISGGLAINGGLGNTTSQTAVTNGFMISDSNYVTVEGFEVTIPQNKTWDQYAIGAGFFISGNNNMVRNNYIHDTLQGGISLNTNASNNKILNNKILRGGTGSGIAINGTGNTIENNDISHTIQHPLCKKAAIANKTSIPSSASGPDADGMKIEGTYQVVRANYIHDISASDDGNSCRVWNAASNRYENYSLPHFDGVQLSGTGGSDLTFERNIIDLSNIYSSYKDDNGVSSCQTSGGSDVPRKNQSCWYTAGGSGPVWQEACKEDCYTQGIYINGGGTRNVKVSNNVIRTCQPVNFVYVVGGSIFNNTLIQGSPIDSGHGVQVYNNSQNVRVFNNIIYGAATTKYENYLAVYGSTSIAAGNNLYYNIGGPVNLNSNGSVASIFSSGNDVANQNPLFTGYSGGKFDLQSGSPAINKGANTELTNDLLGNVRPYPVGGSYDIGAYEYQTSASKSCDCTGKTCGDDGCGNSCGSCQANQTCQAGQCITTCIPKTCSQLGKNCGSQTDGCDGTLNCGTCTASQNCKDGSCCTPNWSCTDWGVCTGNSQTRVCTDSNNCDTTINKPVTAQNCTAACVNTCTGYYKYWGRKYYYTSCLIPDRCCTQYKNIWGDVTTRCK